MKVKLIEVIPDNCFGCQLCEMACSFYHEQECSHTKSRIKILKDSEWAFDFPLLCIQCAEAPCIEVCSTEALHRDETTGVVLAEDELCIDCGLCVTACPIRALALLDEGKVRILKCDMCGGDPECVKWCPSEALTLKEVDLDSPARAAYMDRSSKLLQIVS